MDVLVAVDGSETSTRALREAAEFAERFDAALHVVHVSDSETEATDEVLDRAQATLSELGVDAAVELDVIEMDMPTPREVGRELLQYVERGDYDHLFMGHEDGGTVERVILGSAAETVARDVRVPVTVVPRGE